ncbi:MAG TPA: NAD-dependent epimerase/dehydratase family protein, partial [Phycisphaerales bacterium]|nr:NAD-dependent epimerase/dehydratase family protein [Phycisphaerales bacterium]
VLGSTSFSRWAYACSKAIDEFLGLAYHQEYGLPVVIGRFFNTIGSRQTGKYGMVVPRFVEAALNGRALEVFGTGEQTRCFCYVGDLVEALVMLMASDTAVGRAYNIGSDEEISISALADRIIEMTTSRSGKTFIPYDVAYGRPIEDMMRRVPGLSRIRRAVGWRPRTSLEDTLALIIEDKRR